MAELQQKNEMTLAEKLASLNWGGSDYPAYEGRLDRAAQNAAKNAENTATGVQAQEQASANEASAALTPFYRQEMNATHAFNPEQTNELLNYAEGPAAGSAATTAGKASSEMARTRNTSGFAPALDQAARDRNSAVSTASEGVGAQDILGAKQLNQEGAEGMAGMYGTDTNAMLKAMGQQGEDINSWVNADNSRGWMQQLNDAMKMAGKVGSSIAGGGGDS
jgi:hypothetical protein